MPCAFPGPMGATVNRSVALSLREKSYDKSFSDRGAEVRWDDEAGHSIIKLALFTSVR